MHRPGGGWLAAVALVGTAAATLTGGAGMRGVTGGSAPAMSRVAVENSGSLPAVVRGGAWYLRTAFGGPERTIAFSFGRPGDVPVTGDWNGDGTVSAGVMRGSTWYLRNATSSGPAELSFQYGGIGDRPIAADWNGDGVDTPAVLRGSQWFVRQTNAPTSAVVSFGYGRPGDLPVAGDWNGDGIDTVGVVRGSTWYLRNGTVSGLADRVFNFGRPGDRPVVGDWNGDGIDTVGVVRGNAWYVRNSNTAGPADAVVGFGRSTDQPVVWSPVRTALPPGLAGSQWTTLPTVRPVIALTFDAGANAAGVPAILRTLDQAGVVGTFFLTGRWTQVFPAEARVIAARFPLANHSYTHPHLPQLTDAQVRGEIDGTRAQIAAVTGQETRPLFRFPFGDSDPRTLGLVNSAGYGSYRWTVDSLGWQGTSGGQSVRSVTDRVVAALRPGAVVLMHVGSHPTDGSTLDADALPGIISAARARGFGFVTVRHYR